MEDGKEGNKNKESKNKNKGNSQYPNEEFGIRNEPSKIKLGLNSWNASLCFNRRGCYGTRHAP